MPSRIERIDMVDKLSRPLRSPNIVAIGASNFGAAVTDNPGRSLRYDSIQLTSTLSIQTWRNTNKMPSTNTKTIMPFIAGFAMKNGNN
ncbi:MAG: hypothetical protein ACE1ZV_01870 [Alphaproteobacteria bacterium]